jgi:lysophospholipase L1-like esterase
VNYPAPAITGGAAPVNVSCAPASGSAFPLGATNVNCTATDAQSRTASCAFTVTLNHRQLTTTKFVAFGDSLTAGENGRSINFMPVVDLANAYPTYLQQFFNDRIPTQTFTVVNAGLSGERVVDNDVRLKDAIARHQPQVLLLLEGINDLNNGASAQIVVNGLRDSIRTARDRGVSYVFVSTLLPVSRDVCGPPPPRCRATDTPIPVLLETNDLIRAMVPSNGAHLVDRFDEFVANRATYIDVDGLHMRPDGYRALASAFWDRIVQVIPPAQLFGG